MFLKGQKYKELKHWIFEAKTSANSKIKDKSNKSKFDLSPER